ncbi:MAG TPA: 50S ribosomal protein L32e, partial [Thermoplasmatales archaeon]|nr:50S ribosomal protein L32e [Thermoplasmatales archaeon]HEX16936.1 50S ribosomal protein L32e [Thermoplasmatales archaeon]
DKEPEFLRQEWFRYKRVGECWRRPKGLHSKMRKGLKYRPPRVKIGYRGPRLARGLHPSGFEEVMVYRVEDLDRINPERQAIRIGGTVGVRKRIDIVKKADEMGIRVLNRGEL